tara:strand:+ start:201 stop:353 length:153 start_codon:yes stop_codon:yes gene_type:complete
MEKLVSKVQTSMNSTFKSQLPGEYTKVLKEMSDDIAMQSDIKRVFGIDDL